MTTTQLGPTGPAYITTPIYYVNDRPHIGHCYTTLVADCLARFERLRRGTGHQASGIRQDASVFFLTGTDEHADKVVTSAQQHGMTAIEWADKNAEEFRKAFAFMNASNDDFIRTTQDRHKARVIEYVTAMLKSGAMELGTYEGWYDENQEEYLTETVAKEQEYKSAVTGKPLIRRSEKCYFFRLSRYQARLEKLFAEHPEFVQPEARRNEVLGRFRQGLQDIPISRPVTDDPATQFGIRVPGDEAHRIYVWIDALFNYLSVVDTDERRHFWPGGVNGSGSTCVHFIAKDILWFHAVIWPAMLMALHDADPKRFGFVGLPTTVYSHAYWVREGKKMSKSLKNFIEIEQLQAYASKYSLDAVRWYLLTQGPLHAQDADFSHSKFIEVYNADLANGIGNCASRVANMIEKYFGGKVPEPAGAVGREKFEREVRGHVHQAIPEILNRTSVNEILLIGSTFRIWVDELISETKPFTLAKTAATNPQDEQRLRSVLYECAEMLRIASILLSPAMPEKMAALQKLWNCTPPAGATLEELCTFGGPHALKPGQMIAKGDALFMRADPAEAPPA
ncbi:MAG TPA: methionine--tRNA ligase [Phycisphaerales bacterium]|nr:methionine--tRNA ligase [Phycisphaerales bacterium]